MEQLIQRQQKILRNKALCAKLPDKGAKVKRKMELLKIAFEDKVLIMDCLEEIAVIEEEKQSIPEMYLNNWNGGEGLQDSK